LKSAQYARGDKEHMMPKVAKDMTLDELMSPLCFPPDSQEYKNAQAVITVRQTQAQLNACDAQIRAAEAETRAAEAAIASAGVAERNAGYMLASVIVAAIAAIASAVSAIATVHPFK
jgi:hypothetical protein